MPTKVPPPIIPNRGGRSSFRESRPKKPDWEYWGDIPAPELWQLVALSCDVEPTECNAPDNTRINDLSDFLETDPVFTKRLAVAKANLDQFTPKVRRGNVDRWEIPVHQFVAFARSKRTFDFDRMPEEFKSLGQEAEHAASCTTLPPATPEQLAAFAYPDADAGLHRVADWKRLCSDAKKNGLDSAIVTRGAGRRPHTFDPERVAAWLIETRHQNPATVALGLLRIIPTGRDEYADIEARWQARARVTK